MISKIKKLLTYENLINIESINNVILDGEYELERYKKLEKYELETMDTMFDNIRTKTDEEIFSYLFESLDIADYEEFKQADEIIDLLEEVTDKLLSRCLDLLEDIQNVIFNELREAHKLNYIHKKNHIKTN